MYAKRLQRAELECVPIPLVGLDVIGDGCHRDDAARQTIRAQRVVHQLQPAAPQPEAGGVKILPRQTHAARSIVREPKIKEIQCAVAKWCHITVERLVSIERVKLTTNYRLIAMFLSRKLTSKSYAVIGRQFERNHTTVINAAQIVSYRDDLLREAQAIEREIMGRNVVELPGKFPWRVGQLPEPE